MTRLSNLLVSNKLLTLMFSFAIFLIVVGCIGYYYIVKRGLDVNETYNNNLVPMKQVNDSRIQAREFDLDLFELFISKDVAPKN